MKYNKSKDSKGGGSLAIAQPKFISAEKPAWCCKGKGKK